MAVCGEMEIRAGEETPLSTDLTPAIPPIAAVLHDKFLHSHCSSCFCLLPISVPLLSCSACCSAVRYCSADCSAVDSDLHLFSGECRFFTLRPIFTSGDSADVRAALRLIAFFERFGLLPFSPPRRDSLRRIFGLLVNGLDDIMDEGGEMAETIREGAVVMARSRNIRVADVCLAKKVSIEEEVLWAVMTNAVEVDIDELGGIGVAVYGPCFSWFNHSCVPNACYRFERYSISRPFIHGDMRSFRVYMACSDGGGFDPWKMWIVCADNILAPRIRIRNIKPLDKDDEVCIAYVDLLQPKEFRRFELWSKYRFVCNCERCCASPQRQIDRLLSCGANSIGSEIHCCSDSPWMSFSDSLEEAVAEFMVGGDSETCCRKLENMLSESFDCNNSKASEPRFRLHPHHFLSLKAHIVLSSLYRSQASIIDSTDLNMETFNKARCASAYSLLTAYAIHHFFLFEPSIMPSAALFWIAAGEAISNLFRTAKRCRQASIDPHQFSRGEDEIKSQENLMAVSARFISSVSASMMNIWPFLTEGHSHLKCIENPATFNWLHIREDDQRYINGRNGCSIDWNGMYHLSVSCLNYGGYLAEICYGPKNHFSKKNEILKLF